jgi:hypothetical protein
VGKEDKYDIKLVLDVTGRYTDGESGLNSHFNIFFPEKTTIG